MQFISRGKSPSFVMVHGSRQIVQTTVGNEVKVVRPAVVEFEALRQPFVTSILPAQGPEGRREAHGILYPDRTAARFRKIGHTFRNDDGDDITEQAIVDFMFSHPRYGLDFVAIGEDGGEVLSEDRYLVPEGDSGGKYCILCDKHLPRPQGIEGHKNSNAHQENFRKAEEAARDSLSL